MTEHTRESLFPEGWDKPPPEEPAEEAVEAPTEVSAEPVEAPAAAEQVAPWEPPPPPPSVDDQLGQVADRKRVLAHAALEIRQAEERMYRDYQAGLINSVQAMELRQQNEQLKANLANQLTQLDGLEGSLAGDKETAILRAIPTWTNEDKARKDVQQMTDYLSTKFGRTITNEDIGRMKVEEIKQVRDEMKSVQSERSAYIASLEKKKASGATLTNQERMDLGDARIARLEAKKVQQVRRPERPKSKAEQFRADAADLANRIRKVDTAGLTKTQRRQKLIEAGLLR